jgi:hypothetical protein
LYLPENYLSFAAFRNLFGDFFETVSSMLKFFHRLNNNCINLRENIFNNLFFSFLKKKQ